MKWTRLQFARAYAGRQAHQCGAVVREMTLGWVLTDERDRRLWGFHRDSGWWRLTHLPTGCLVVSDFRRLAEGKQFAEELSAEVDCGIGRFGDNLRGARGVRPFMEALKRLREKYGFQPVRLVQLGGIECGPARGAR